MKKSVTKYVIFYGNILCFFGSVYACGSASSFLFLDLKIDRPHGQAKVINYRLIEEHSQTFNEGLFLPSCKLYNKCICKKGECSL